MSPDDHSPTNATSAAPPATSYRVVHVEDNAIDAEAFSRCLHRVPDLSFEVALHQTLAAGRDALTRHPDAILVLDHNLGPGSGIELLHELRAAGDRRPVIVLSGHGERKLVDTYIDAGADGFLTKDDLAVTSVTRAVRLALARFRDRSRSP